MASILSTTSLFPGFKVKFFSIVSVPWPCVCVRDVSVSAVQVCAVSVCHGQLLLRRHATENLLFSTTSLSFKVKFSSIVCREQRRFCVLVYTCTPPVYVCVSDYPYHEPRFLPCRPFAYVWRRLHVCVSYVSVNPSMCAISIRESPL